MNSSTNRQSAEAFQIRESVSKQLTVSFESIVLYQNLGHVLSVFFSSLDNPKTQVVTATPAIAEIAMAADKAEMKLVEAESTQPFVGDIDSIKNFITSRKDVIYLANPNRVTGTSYSLAQIRKLAALVNEGLLIVDEFYHDFSSLTAVSLVKECSNVVILRPFQDWTSKIYSECGYALLGQKLVNQIGDAQLSFNLDRITLKNCLEIFEAEKSNVALVKSIQKQALKTALELAEIGIKSRIISTDSILIQFSNFSDVRQYLAARDIQIEPISERGQSKDYLRYRIAGDQKDTELIKALKSMPDSQLLFLQSRLKRAASKSTSEKTEENSALM